MRAYVTNLGKAGYHEPRELEAAVHLLGVEAVCRDMTAAGIPKGKAVLILDKAAYEGVDSDKHGPATCLAAHSTVAAQALLAHLLIDVITDA